MENFYVYICMYMYIKCLKQMPDYDEMSTRRGLHIRVQYQLIYHRQSEHLLLVHICVAAFYSRP